LYPAAGCWVRTRISCAIRQQKEASSSSISPPTTVRGSLRLWSSMCCSEQPCTRPRLSWVGF